VDFDPDRVDEDHRIRQAGSSDALGAYLRRRETQTAAVCYRALRELVAAKLRAGVCQDRLRRGLPG
jgi:hypothetical protein